MRWIYSMAYKSKEINEDLKTYLQYELVPFPLAFFNEGEMRKSTKSVLYKLLDPTIKGVHVAQLDLVMDGGLLLHKVILQ